MLKSDTTMEGNPDNYVLVLEDRREAKSPTDPGRLSVVSGQDEKGKIKTVEPTEENRAAFLVFKKNDGLLKNFMTNLRRQFNDPTHFGVYRVVADQVGESVEALKSMLAAREMPQNKAALDTIRVSSDESPAPKLPAIDPEKVDWKELERLGVSREKLKAGGNLDRLLNWQKTRLISLAVPFGDNRSTAGSPYRGRRSPQSQHPYVATRTAARFPLYGAHVFARREGAAPHPGQPRTDCRIIPQEG